MDNVNIKNIIEKLKNNINETNHNKSSHWKVHAKKIDEFLDITKNYGFGSFEKKSFKKIFYFFLKRLVFGNKVFKTLLYKNCKIIFDKLHREMDSDVMRHIFTFNKIKEYIEPKSICIIGDGKLNGILCAHLMFPEAKIFSINISEVLIHDLIILNQMNLKIKNQVILVENLNTKYENSSLILVPANLKRFLLNKNIDLFINIASFQEMTTNEIDNYFDIIKNNKGMLYCCNREYKKLIGGEETNFNKYPFSNCTKIFWEDCSWYKKYYSLRYPFIKNFPVNIKHCLVDYSD